MPPAVDLNTTILCPKMLGDVRLRDEDTGEIILVPTPSDDPNDPLNWSQPFKHAIAALICLSMLVCNFLAAGPTIAIIDTAVDFFPDADDAVANPDLLAAAVAAVAYFFTTTALIQGTGNFVWVPLANKYGRRPVFLFSYAIYLACAVWLVYEQSYAGFLAGRILMGFGSGAAETIAPITIADIFFLHERGTVMAMYTSFLSVGVSLGILCAGLITINNDWRAIYAVAAVVIAAVLLAGVFLYPETARTRFIARAKASSLEADKPGKEDSIRDVPRKETFIQSLRVFTGTHTSESIWRIAARPLGLIMLPPVLWAALVQAVTIGFLVAVTSNVDVAFEGSYGFEKYQVGLCFASAIVGSIVGIFAGGHLSDRVADFLTRRNGGVRSPEMRLPAMLPSLVAAPLALVLFGVGIEYNLHWMCPTMGLGLLSFAIAQGTNVCLVYVIDAYRPVAGEVTLAVMGFKSIFGFLLSFYTNPWIDEAGFMDAYGCMAGIAAGVIVLWVPLYFWGARIRRATLAWPVMAFVDWSPDREVGE